MIKPFLAVAVLVVIPVSADAFVLKDWRAENWTEDSIRIQGAFSDVWMEHAVFVATVHCGNRYIGNLSARLRGNHTFVDYVTGGPCNGTVELRDMGLEANDVLYPVLPSKTPGILWSELSPSEISSIQHYLNHTGYDAGDMDGKAGPKTRAAAKLFSDREGRKVTRPNAVDDLLHGWAHDI